MATYEVSYDGRRALRVEATLGRGAPQGLFGVESGAEAFISELEAAADAPRAAFRPGERSGRGFKLAECAAGPCRVRYRFALREAARRLDDVDTASEEGDVIESPPSTWLLTPSEAEDSERVRFRVTTAGGTQFVSGVFRAPDDHEAFEIASGDLWTSPYSAFGPLRMRELELNGANLTLAIGPTKLAVSDADLEDWTKSSARAITTYFGRFPLPSALVLVVPGRGGWIGEGKTLAGGGGSIFMRVGERAGTRALANDWVLVHEMTHLAFPSVPRQHDWAEEGLATYVEPFARARAHTMTAEAAWRGLMEGLPNGLPGPNDRGLDRTPTWGRRYWGGALYYLLADVDIRRRTKNRLGLEHALRGVLAAGGNNARRWPLDEVFAAGDAAVGVASLTELYRAMSTSPHPVDLDALFAELGLARDPSGAVRFDDRAPLADIRRAITQP